jgi:hypothetical protein
MDKRRYQKKREGGKCLLRYFITWLIVVSFFLITGKLYSQELFPNTEPASTMPKKLVGFRQINEMYRDINNRERYFAGFRVMYGLTKKLTVMSMIGYSNHHFKNFPTNFVGFINNHHQKQYPLYPFLIEGIHVYAKYRLVNFDGEQKHFRIAAYGEATKSFIAHTEAESSTMTDNTGYGGGLIFTKLHKRFATSVTWGFINSIPYQQNDGYREIKFKSGNVVMYNVSFGYRIYPKVYDSYKNINVNIYSEFINKDYKAAQIYYDGKPYDYSYLNVNIPGTTTLYTYRGLAANRYSEMRTSLQFIFDSSTRLDIGAAVPVYSRSYLHDYPLIFINIQKYFFK